MEWQSVFEKFRKKIVRESVWKSVFAGFLVFAAFVFAFEAVSYVFAFKYFWLGLVVGGAVWTAAALTFYFVLFKPTDRQIASRLDGLGLEQRVSTMNELKEDDSPMATLQREDALRAVGRVQVQNLRIFLPVWLLVASLAALVLSAGMATVAGLSAAGRIRRGGEVIEEIVRPRPTAYEVHYGVEGDEGGEIEGEPDQVVFSGEDATAVLAVPAPDYVFVQWSDGLQDPYRFDTALFGDLSVSALFQEAEESEGNGADDDERDEGDDDDDRPSENTQSERTQTTETTSADATEGGDGMYEEHNQVIDGQTYYGGSTYKNAYDEAMETVSQDTDMSDERKEIIEDYLKTIEK